MPDQIWSVIEDKMLAIIELYYNNVIMSQDSYPNIVLTFKTLRVEGVKFPKQKPSDLVPIQFIGQ